MCGRFALLTSGDSLLSSFEVDTTPLDLSQLGPRYNIAPTQPVLAVRTTAVSDQRELTLFRWGLIPSWAKDMKMGARMINARSETVAEKPAFRSAFKRRRCLIPADGFYEWQKQNGGKQPLYIRLRDERPFALAGLWEIWQSPGGDELETCTILTTTPNELMEPIHNRMPVLLHPDDYDEWLHPGASPQTALHLLRPYPAEEMEAYPVSPHVNSPTNDDPACIAPIAA
ncbi:MAG: SOS response-associated peptidase [Ardenticatenaceae bacterium]|nr:SOS response-associated peptidase [Anaerolineales bacterium]MCB8985887.1 SOS response-associated peptidase [Ardenticatenaceae bacterium]